jgi:hypothetical protein
VPVRLPLESPEVRSVLPARLECLQPMAAGVVSAALQVSPLSAAAVVCSRQARVAKRRVEWVMAVAAQGRAAALQLAAAEARTARLR